MLRGRRYSETNPHAVELRPLEPIDQGKTVTDLVASYLEFLQASRQPTTYRDAANALRARILPKFGHMKLWELRAEDLEAAHRADPKPVAANRALAYLKAAWNRGERMRWCPPQSNPLRWLGDFTHQERPRSRVLSDEELSRVLAEIGLQRAAWHGESSPAPAWAAILLILLTGCRHREVLLLRWKEVQAGALHLEHSKTGPKVIFLSEAAAELLQRLRLEPPVRPRDPEERVFEGVDLRRAWEKIRDAAGCPDATIHDLRRTYASRLLASGKVELVDVAKALGQKTLRVTAFTYSPLTARRQRDIAEIGAAQILHPERAE
jgi:integrase